MTRPFLLGLVACAAGACGGEERQPPASAAGSALAAHAVATAAPDSQYDIAAQLRRFRDSVADHPSTLADASASRDALVRRFVRAIETADTVALERLQLSAGEFAYFYYPESKLSRPPYELEPQLMWMQIQVHGARGRARLLQKYGGRSLGFRAIACQAPEEQGAARLHECSVQHAPGASGRAIEERLFGTILERQGRFKFVSYANKL